MDACTTDTREEKEERMHSVGGNKRKRNDIARRIKIELENALHRK